MRSENSLSLPLRWPGIIYLAAILVAGCQSAALLEPLGTLPTVPFEITDKELGNDVLVFGRVRWIQNGQERDDYRSAYGWNIWPEYYGLEDRRNGTLAVAEDGTFVWQLPGGTYLAYQLRWFDPWDGPHRLPLRLAFRAEKAQRAYCIGTIIVKLEAKRDLIGGLWIKDWDLVLDDTCATDQQWFARRYINLTLPVEQSFLVYDPAIPDSLEALERRDTIADILRALYPLLSP